MKTACRRFLTASLAALALSAAAAPPIPGAGQRVTELTATLDAGEQRALAAELERIEKESGARVLVLIVDSLDGEEISAYATRVFDAWRPGRAGIDDGVLVVLSRAERRVRIEVGRGLEGAIPDVVTHRPAAEAMVPAFRRGEFARGLTDAVQEIGRLAAIEQQSRASRHERPTVRAASQTASTGEPWYFFPVLAVLVLFAAGLALRRRRDEAPQIYSLRPLTEKESRFLSGLTSGKHSSDEPAMPWERGPTSAATFTFGGGGSASSDTGSSASASSNSYDTASSSGTSAGAGSETSY